MTIPPVKAKVLQDVVHDLKQVRDVAAIVLGGSHAIGMANDQSDLDIGLYYHQERPFDIGEIKSVAKRHEVEGTSTVPGFYEWGRWVNGGAWINTQ